MNYLLKSVEIHLVIVFQNWMEKIISSFSVGSELIFYIIKLTSHIKFYDWFSWFFNNTLGIIVWLIFINNKGQWPNVILNLNNLDESVREIVSSSIIWNS
jgi:hypothetical protein